MINRDGAGRTFIAAGATALALATALAGGAGRAGAAPRAAAPAGTITTVAGGVGGPARATAVALFACGVASQHGSLFVADGPAVRRVAANDQLTTPAGTGVGIGPADSGGLATGSNLDTCAVAADGAGNLLIAEQNHLQVSVVAATSGSFYGQAMTAGHLYPVAGGGLKLGGIGDGGPATKAELGQKAGGVRADANGNLVLADSSFNRIRVVATTS